MIKIPKSLIEGRDFQKEVEEHIANIIAHRDIVGKAPPAAGTFVEEAIRRERRSDGGPDDLTADYEIIDDTPPPPTREQRIQIALADLRAKEQAEIEALVPSHKRRLLEMEYNRANQRVGYAKVHGQAPNAADEATIQDFTNLQKAVGDIQYAYAQREAAIEEGE